MEHPQRTSAPNWRWRTFPVFFAFCAGLLAASLVNRQIDTAFEAIVSWIALLGVGYGFAHLFVSNVIVAGRIRRREQRIAHSHDVRHDEWEDEIVHPDGTAT